MSDFFKVGIGIFAFGLASPHLARALFTFALVDLHLACVFFLILAKILLILGVAGVQ